MNARLILLPVFALALLLTGCDRPKPAIQGYLEADMVYIAPVIGGRIDHIDVKRGDRVTPGTRLFIQDSTEQNATLAEAQSNLAKTQSDLEDLLKGFRLEELNALQSKINRMTAVVRLDTIEFQRSERLRKQDAISAKDFDNYRLTLERDKCELEEAQHNLSIGKLPARSDRIKSAEAAARSAANALIAARWRLDQRQVTAPYAGIIFDVLMRNGEFAGQGTPVVALLPADKLKVRFFVAPALASTLRRGQKIEFRTTSNGPVYTAPIDYIAPRPEYTPPVIYSNDNREKMVFMIEAAAQPADLDQLHPGLPVIVKILPGDTP